MPKQATQKVVSLHPDVKRFPPENSPTHKAIGGPSRVLRESSATALPMKPPAFPATEESQFPPPPAVSKKQVVAAAPRPQRVALKGSQIVVQPDGQPMDPRLCVRFFNSSSTPVAHLRVWLGAIYYDDLPKNRTSTRDLSQLDPEVLGQPIPSGEYSVPAGANMQIPVDGYRPNHQLIAPGVQAIYVYYVYVDSAGVLHEPEPSVFLFTSKLPGFTEVGLRQAWRDAWVRDGLLSLGRESVSYRDMIGEFGDKR